MGWPVQWICDACIGKLNAIIHLGAALPELYKYGNSALISVPHILPHVHYEMTSLSMTSSP